MTKSILLVATHRGAGLTSSVLGLSHAIEKLGVKVALHKPVLQCACEASCACNSAATCTDRALSISPERIQQALKNQKIDELMEEALQHFVAAKADADIVVMEGLLETPNAPYAHLINQKIAHSLGADVIVVSSADVESIDRLERRLSFAGEYFAGRLLGAIINRVGGEGNLTQECLQKSSCFNDALPLLATISENAELAAPRVLDLQRHLDAEILFSGEINSRRIYDYVLFARSVQNAIPVLRDGVCVFSPADRDDTLMAVTTAVASGTHLACLVLTGEERSDDAVMRLCKPLLEKSKLPVLRIKRDSWESTRAMEGFNAHLAADDKERIEKIRTFFVEHLNKEWIKNYVARGDEQRLSPAAFRYNVVQKAIAAKKTIVLPEGDEPRTVVAASQCAARGMAKCVLLAKPERVHAVAAEQGVTLGDGISIIDPEQAREQYVARLVELRKHKGMDEATARSQLENNVMLGTLMLEAGEVDGLVSGAVHTTADTMRPPLQLIKTEKGASMVSSVFFMCLPEQVLVYGDCAIVPKPTADDLAQIAIQSNDTAKAFGIEPKVAMISYSTGNSGQGEDVEKVKAATAKVRELRPDIIVDGPMQYDAASVASVGRAKAPNSPVAGQATVFVFPDLNTGNTTYKAVQRTAHAVSMGPVLQGMRKPVNDLSRGALIEDIVYTIALTAVQATLAE